MAKKKKKSLLPKRIAGVKVPKSVRKGRLGELLASKAGQALLAEAVMAAGAVAAAKKAGRTDKMHALTEHTADRLRHLGHGASHKGRDMSAAGGALAFALGEAARSFVDALTRRDDERPLPTASPLHADGDDRIWTATSMDDEDEDEAPASKKKPISYEAGPV